MLDFFVRNGFDYIEEKIKAGEQVALLAYTKKNVMQMADIVKKHFPDAEIANLVPEQVCNSTIFTSYIKRYDTEMAYLPFNDYSMQVSTDIMNRLDMLVPAKSYDSSKKPVAKMLYKWRCENAATVNEWYRQFTNQQLSKKDFVKNVQKNMVQFEIMNNAIRQSLASKRNQDNKELQNIKNANILLSTIHSAKGLEFDNTIVLYQADNKMIEPNKRMYYVAFTRAMKSEYILAYDTVVNPKIVADYEAIENALINKGIA